MREYEVLRWNSIEYLKNKDSQLQKRCYFQINLA